MGILYDHSLAALVAFSMAAQILGVVWILILDGRMRSDRTVRATQ